MLLHKGRVWAPLHQGFFNDRREAIGLNLGKIFTGEGTRMKVSYALYHRSLKGSYKLLGSFRVCSWGNCCVVDSVRCLERGFSQRKRLLRLGKDKTCITRLYQNVKIDEGLNEFGSGKRGVRTLWLICTFLSFAQAVPGRMFYIHPFSFVQCRSEKALTQGHCFFFSQRFCNRVGQKLF